MKKHWKKITALILCFTLFANMSVQASPMENVSESNNGDTQTQEDNTIPEPENNTNNISKLNDCALKNVPNSLLVTSEVKDFETCGATSITQYKNLFVLEYETEEQAETAYETLCNDSNIYSVEWNPTIETNIETENTKYEVNEEKVDLKEYFSNTAESVVAVLDVEDEKIDENEHETKVINTIRENNESILIIPIKVVDENGLSTTLKIYAGIQKALENGANIIVLNITNKQIESSKILCNEITTLKNNGIQILMQTNEIADETVENPTEETLNKEITDDILNTNSNDTEKTGEETENVVSEAKNAEEIENTDISEIESQIKKTVAFTIDTVIDLNTSDAGDSATHDCQKYLVSKYDANYHWKQCSICGKVFQKTSHTMTGTWTLGNSCSANNVYRSACSCGYSLVTKNTRTHQHLRWNANQKIHVRWCDDCNEGVGASEPHRDANGNVLNCSNRGKCVVCGLTPSRHESTLFWSEYKNAFSSNASEQGYCSGCGKQGIKNYKVSNIVHNGSTVTFDISYSLASGYSFANIGGNNGVVYPSGAGTCSVVHSRSGNTMTDHVTAVLNYAGVFRISWNGVDLVDLSGTAFGLGMYADVKAENQSPVITGFNPKNLSTVNGWGTKTQITLTGTENFGNQVNITVKGEDGTLYVNNVATNVSNNKWTYTFTPNIEASTTGKKLTVTVTDLSKNSTSWTYSVYSVDGIAPICKATDTTDTKWSKTKSYIATCTDEGAGKINISALNASNYEQATVSGNNFSKTYTFTGDIYGSKEIPIYYKDFAGNVSTSFLTVYNLDNTAPTITNATSTTGAGKADITIKANDVNTKLNKSGSGISSYGISDSNVGTPTSWQQDNKITVFDNGTKYVYAKDVAGNISAPFKIEVTVNSEVTFDANSGKCDVTQKTFSYGKTYGALPTPTRTGYTFEGWYTEDGAKITEDSDVIKKSAITFYAKWTPNIYTVTFNANGGDVNTSSKKVTFDEKYGTLPIPTRTNHKFVGWKNNGNTVTEDTIYKETGNTTLVAEWKLTHCIVNFDTNDGTTIKSQNKEIGSAYGNLSIPNKKGYDFIGWYTEKNGGGEKVQKTSVVPQKEEITLYAYYKLHPITVKIPKKLITDEKGNSTFKISADNQVGTISVKTSEKIIFTQKNKSQKVTGKIILDKNILNASQHEITGKISTNGLSAGTWKGTFNIDLSFVE